MPRKKDQTAATASQPEVDGPASPGGFLAAELSKGVVAAIGGSIAGVALLIIPTAVELFAARGKAAFAYTLAEVLPPPALSTRLLTGLLPGIFIGLLTAWRVTAWLYPAVAKAVTRGRWVITAWLAGSAVIGVGGAYLLTHNSMQAFINVALAAAMMAFGVDMAFRQPQAISLESPADRQLLVKARVVGLLFAALGAGIASAAADPFPNATFLPLEPATCKLAEDAHGKPQVVPAALKGEPVTGRLIATTSTGVWLLAGNGRPQFCTGALDTLVIQD